MAGKRDAESFFRNSLKLEDIKNSCNFEPGTEVKLTYIPQHSDKKNKELSYRSTSVIGRVVQSYPYFVNIRIRGAKGDSYILSIDKHDLISNPTYKLEVRY